MCHVVDVLTTVIAHMCGSQCEVLSACMQAVNSAAFIELLLAAGRALGPIIRQFFSLGLNRVWLNAGDTAYK